MNLAVKHKFSAVGPRGKRRTVDGELPVNITVGNGRVVATNPKGNVMVNCSHALWDALLSRGYVHEATDPWGTA